MQSLKSLTLCRRSCQAWGSDCDAISFANTSCQYVCYAYKRPSHWWITILTRPQIVDAPLTHIFGIGQGAWYYYFWFGRQPILSLWMAATNRHLSYPRCTDKNRWRSIEAHFQNGAAIMWFTLLPRKAASMPVMDSSDHVTIQLLDLQEWKSLTLRWRSF